MRQQLHSDIHLSSENVWQPELHGEFVALRPLKESDFETLHSVASDPLIWEQHPDFERYKVEKFKRYFDSAINSKGAFVITDKTSGEVIGSTRYTEYSQTNSSVVIGYTFLIRKFWGGLYNKDLKSLMLDYAFQFVEIVYFIVGRNNQRSRKAMEKIGGVLVVDTTGLPLDGDLTQAVVYKIEKGSSGIQRVLK